MAEKKNEKKKKKNKKEKERKKLKTIKEVDYGKMILGVTIGIAAVLFAIGGLVGIGALGLGMEWIDFVLLGGMIAIGPYGFYIAREQKKIKQIEKRLPDFLRDVAEAGRFGMTLADAVIVASSGRYGKLTPEIKKMAAQIGWGVPANEALRLFSERINTPLVNKVTAIIIKANDAGGSVADVLTMVAHDAKEEQMMESERKITMSTYVAVIYIAFVVFLVTILIMAMTFLPKMELAARSAAEGAEEAGMDIPMPVAYEIIPELHFIFLLAAVAHAIGDGILAGTLETGDVRNGLRHSFIMLLIAFGLLRVYLVYLS